MRIWKTLAAIALAVALPCLAQAQTAPGWTYGQVPTPAQWNAVFAGKQDYLGAPPLLVTGGTMTGPLVTAASALGAAGLNLPPGAPPTSPNNGDFWSTSSGFYGQVNGVTVGPFVGAGSSTFAATAPLAVTFPSGVVNYALNYNSSLYSVGSSPAQLAVNPAYSNTFTVAQNINLNGGALASAQSGTVQQVSNAAGTIVRHESDSYAASSHYTGVRFDGTVASPTGLVAADEIVSLNAWGYNGAAVVGPRAGFRCYSDQTWTTGANGSYCDVATTPDGSTTMAEVAKFAASGGVVFGSSGSDPGAGNLNLAGGALYNNGAAPTGTGAYVRAAGAAVSSLTVTTAFNATGLVTNADLVNSSVTVNGTVCTLGSTCAPTATAASITVGTTLVNSGAGLLYVASAGGTLAAVTTANNGALVTNGSGAFSISSTLPSGMAIPGATASALTVTGSFTATGLVTNADLASAVVTVNGTPCTLGSSCAPAGPLNVGASIVNSGSNGYVLYDNAGVLGNLATTGTGSVVLAGGPTINTLTVTTAFNATGLVTVADLASVSGTGSTVVLTASPTFTGSPVLATPTATSVAVGGCTIGSNVLCVTGSSSIGTLASAAITITSSSAAALSVGPNGAINPAFVVNASTASQAAGLSVTGAASGGTVAIATVDSGSNNNLTINAKGTGTIGIGNVSTGAVTITPATTITGALTLSGGLNTPLVGTYGGTGVNNGSNTITVAGNFSTSAALAVTAGTTGQLAYWSSGTAIAGENITSALTAGTNISITGTTNATIAITGQIALANGGTNASLTASNGGIVYSTGSALAILSGTSTTGLCLLSSNLSAPTWGSCSGAAAVSSVANSDGTLTISPTTGSVVASLALGHANTWTGVQTFTNSDLALLGSSTGYTTFTSANASASNYTITLPAATGTVSLLNVADQTIAGGANVTSQSLSAGSITVDCGSRPLQYITGNTSAWTITAPSNDGSCVLFVTNPASSVTTPTFSGFSVGANTGDVIPTTASYYYMIFIVRINSKATYSVKALQ